MDWHILGGDPAPGDVASVRRLSFAYRDVDEHASAAVYRIGGLLDRAGPTIWSGTAAEAFRDRLGALLPGLRRLAEAHELASQALSSYAGQLEQTQSQARVAALRADDAFRDKQRCLASLDLARAGEGRAASSAAEASTRARFSRVQVHSPVVVLADPGEQMRLQHQADADDADARRAAVAHDHARSEAQAATREVDRAAAELEAARRLGVQVAELHRSAGDEVVRRLDAAGPSGESVSSAVRRWVGDRVEDLRVLTASPEFRNVLKVLDAASTILAGAAIVVSFIPFLAPAAPILLAVSTGISVTVFGLTVLAAALGNARTSDVLLAAPIPGGGRLIKVAQPLVSQVKRALFFTDARHATKFWRQIHAAPKVVPKWLERLPVKIEPQRYFQAQTLYNVRGAARDLWAVPEGVSTIWDSAASFHDQPQQDDTVVHRVIDGTLEQARQKVQGVFR